MGAPIITQRAPVYPRPLRWVCTCYPVEEEKMLETHKR